MPIGQRFYIVKVLPGVFDNVRNERQAAITVIKAIIVQRGLPLPRTGLAFDTSESDGYGVRWR